MKPIEQNNTIVSTSKNSTSFGVEANDFMFKVLSDDIYEHKIRAIIRELSCNAYDSHVDAGTPDRPFRIHLPTTFHPYFELEDYGIGLDDYDVRGEKVDLFDEDGNVVDTRYEGGLYTRYFASTKRDSNDKIGALGLGSKSPLAYTKAMTLVTRKDGMEYNYTCTIGEKGPETRYHGCKETDKENGVRIRFSVSPNDIDEFRTEAGFVLATFRVKPECNVSIDYMLNEEHLDTLDEENILVLEPTEEFVRHETAVVYAYMGGVVYPVRNIDYNFLETEYMINEENYNIGVDSEPKYHKFNEFAVNMLRSMNYDRHTRLLVKYDMGELAFLPSREGLSQDQQTKFNFYKGLIDHLDTKLQQIQSDLNNARQPLEALKIYSKFGDVYSREASAYNFKGMSIQRINFDTPFRNITTGMLDDSTQLIMHYHDKRAWYASEGIVRRRVVRDLRMTEIMSIYDNHDEIICFYANDDDEFKATAKPLRFLIKNEDPEDSRYFFILKETGCDQKVFKAIRDVFVGKLKFYHISKLKDMVLDIEPSFYDTKKKPNSPVRKVKKKNETRGRLIMESGLTSSIVLDLDEYDHNNTFVVNYMDSYDVFRTSDDGKMISQTGITTILENSDYKYAIIKNGVNRKKVNDNNFKTCTEVLEELKQKNLSDYEKYEKYENGNFWSFKRSVSRVLDAGYDTSVEKLDNIFDSNLFGYGSEDLMNLVVENDGDLNQAFDVLYGETLVLYETINYQGKAGLLNLIYNITGTVVDSFDTSNQNNEERELSKKFNMLVREMTEKYPLLFNRVDENKSAVVQYVKMMQNENKEAA